ncbi:M23 family metallopeptidase [Patescibacteria group bacterium]|jgi:murein DD-endopeptidase MepM/ murein hydrolase activator NlpD|nr:M23 family metallopeptidase [Patescibacteria group bacterium]
MRPHHIIHVSGVAAFLAVASSAVLAYAYPSNNVAVAAPNVPVISNEVVTSTVPLAEALEEVKEPIFGLPISNAFDRVTKKTFGLEVHPETSPVQNDRFNGFHVGVDFETTAAEADTEVQISAICDGPLISKQFAKGYGGYALQSCELDGEKVVVLYGHMDLERIEPEPKDRLKRGDLIGVLGEGYSSETDGVRKHLHLGVHRGTGIDIRGYVQTTSEVSGWLDVLPYLKP